VRQMLAKRLGKCSQSIEISFAARLPRCTLRFHEDVAGTHAESREEDPSGSDTRRRAARRNSVLLLVTLGPSAAGGEGSGRWRKPS
jgi:hypothetical protein